MKTRRVLAMAASAMLVVFGFTLVAKGLVSPSPSTALMFTFYDDGQDGFGSDHIHIFCPSCQGTTTTVFVTLNGVTQSVTVGAIGDAIVEFTGQRGGPVLIQSSQPVVASQRVFYFSSFAEWYAVPISQADTQLMLNWYDHATSGYVDHIHLANPNGFSVSATVEVAASNHQTTVTLPANGGTFVDFPGLRGGPVFITASSPILASSRTQFEQSFNEVNAIPVGTNNSAGTTLEMNWYDETESFSLDNIQISDASFTGTTAFVTVYSNGKIICQKPVTIQGRGTAIVNCGHIRGGPVLITSGTGGPDEPPIIASQRVLFSNSFNEVYAVPTIPTTPNANYSVLALSWVDLSTSGFSNDNIHIYNSSSNQQTVMVASDPSGTCAIGVCQTFTVGGLQEIITSFPGLKGGPIYILGNTLNDSGGLLVSARTKYNSSFNEVNAAVIQ